MGRKGRGENTRSVERKDKEDKEQEKREKDGKEKFKGEGSKERVEVMKARKVKERTQGVWRGRTKRIRSKKRGKKMERRSSRGKEVKRGWR